MALTLVTSYQLKSSAQGTTPLVTTSFTPSNGEVITVTWETFDPAITMTITNSGSQTIAQKILEQPGGFNGTCGINAGTIAGSPGSMTITGTPSASARYSMTVERWSGAQLAGTPVTDGNTATTGPIQSNLTPTGGAGGVIVWVGQDSQSVDPSTRAYAGSGTDDGTRDDHVGSNGVGYHGYQTITGNTSQAYGLTAPTGVVKWVLAGLEVQPAAGATATYVPPFAGRRRLQVPRRRLVAGSAIKTQVPTAPALPPQPPPPRRLRGLLPRRAHTFAVIPAQVIVTAPAYVPPATRVRPRLARSARPRLAAVPIVQASPPQPARRARLKLPKFFRSSSTQTPAAQVIVTAPAYVPPFLRVRARLARLARGQAALTPVAQQVAPTAPPYVPPFVRVRARLGRLVRGRPATVTPPQIQATAPAYVPPPVRRAARSLGTHRTRGAQVTPPQIVVVPPAYVPPFRRGLRRGLKLFRPRAFQVPANGQAAPVVPPTPPTPPVAQQGSWRGLLSILREDRALLAMQAAIGPQACPNDGEPLRRTIDGLLFCPFDNWRPEGQESMNRKVTGQDWGGMAGVLAGARADAAQDKLFRWISCPNDGEPLSRTVDGIIFCRYDGWMPPDQPQGG